MSAIPNITYRDRNKKSKRKGPTNTKTTKQSDKKVVPFVTTNNPRNPDVYYMISPNLPILQNILDNNEIIKSERQPKNLKHSLTNAKFTDNSTEIPKPKVFKMRTSNL